MKYTMYIGGYGSNSISRVIMQDGILKLSETFSAANASYLCMSPDETKLYAVGETQKFNGEFGGSVHSFDIAQDGSLTETSARPTRGAYPCHLTLVGNLLIVSNYASGSVSRFTLNEDGTIGEMLPLIEFSGAGRDPERQESPHAHQALLTPGGWLAVSDLGTDSVHFYPAPEIAADHPAALQVKTPAGFGPRHCAFPYGQDVWYVLCELRSELLIYRGSPKDAMLIGRVPVGSSANFPAALRLSPNQKLLAATGRGENIIALFSISENGMLAKLTEVSSLGDWPRDVQFSPDGKYLVCANQKSSTLTAFEISNGHLEYRSSLRVSSPACVLFSKQQQEE